MENKLKYSSPARNFNESLLLSAAAKTEVE